MSALQSLPLETSEKSEMRTIRTAGQVPPWLSCANMDNDEVKETDGKSVNVRKKLREALFKSLFIPVLALVFFIVAPGWLSARIRTSASGSVNADSTRSFAQKQAAMEALSTMDFQTICLSDSTENANVRAALTRTGVTADFKRLRWGLILSGALVGILGITTRLLLALNNKARKSRSDLIQAYRLSWKIVMVVAVLKVFILVPLLTYGTFEFSVLLTDHYIPKLLFLIVLGGIFAIWRSASVLLKNVPLEFQEPMARELSKEEAPELWRVVNEAAEKLQTAPPDRILVGLQLNFYVTEMAVRIKSGLVHGRVLYLSHPLLKQLSEEEVIAIIGHELGHFIGEDTQMTREFYPLRLKIRATMIAMAQSGLVGWPSFQLLNFFAWTFGETEQAASRTRELMADKKGSELTSNRIAARALLKFQIAAEAFARGLKDAIRDKAANPLDIPMQAIVREQLAKETDFWSHLFERKLPHPMDSHPSLHDRLEALGESIGVVEAQAIALEESATAHARWFADRQSLFDDLTREAEGAVAKMRTVNQVAAADLNSPEGRELLQKHFPERKWRSKSFALWAVMALLSLLLAGCVALTFVDTEPALRVVAAISAVVLGLLAAGCWTRHGRGELTLNAEGLFYSGWKCPLRFTNVEAITAQRSYSSVTLIFRLKKSQLPIWKFSLVPFHKKSVTYSIGGMDAKSHEIAGTIHRYLTRKINPE